ncbi:MAG: serine/threonine-protein phosphatase [Prevotella sp.]|nr:serine/threonine-protein phosphatase [Prevotella sp.]
MDEYHLDTLSEYSNLLATIGSCQLKLRNPEQAASTFEEVYQNYLQLLKKDRTGSLYKSAIVGMINTVKVYLDEHSFESAYSWTERFDSILTYYEAQPASDKDYADKQRARLNIYRATVLQEMGRDNDAAKAYQAALNTNYAQTADGYIEAIDYLMAAKRWNEAADNLECLDSQISRYGMSLSLDNIQKYYLPKFRANLGARRKDSVIAVGAQICNALDSAIYLARQDDAAELATIYDTQQKEAQIARQREEMTRIQMIAFMVASVLVVGFLFVYILNKRKASQRLKAAHAKLEEAHGQLKVAYDQLEDTTKAKERIESELRIARNIQSSMVPSVFPNREGLDLFASMTPAREVGGDLYDYLLLDDQLYFCVGDVSGKGVPASLFMAQAIRLFRSIAKQRHTPATIATRINNELTEDNEEGMFVTMFIGLVNLKTGRLDYCNAGHNPPVLGVDGNDRFMEVESNAPIGLWPELEYVGEYVETIKGQMLLVYSDGLNEAENRQQQQFGDDHLLDILNRQHFHSSKALIDHLNAEVVRHRDGAEPNDDLTMLSLMIL